MAKQNGRIPYLLEKANSLPLTSGVYIMRDERGKVIYVGKSRKMKNRVSQYFRENEKHNFKTAKMVSSVFDFDYILCDSEIEALTLENVLIKQHTPKYNIKLKDAKSYPYIKLSTNEEYPRLSMTRTRADDRAKYFGPYSGTNAVYSIIDTLNKTLGLPGCKLKFPSDIGKHRPCIYRQMRQCLAPCEKGMNFDEYAAAVNDAAKILGGNFAAAKKSLELRMENFSACENFEAAARCRDSIAALQKTLDRQKVVSSPSAEHDVIAMWSDERCGCISVFYVRQGMLVDKDEFVFSADEVLDISEIGSFILTLYSSREYIPKEILLADKIDSAEISAVEEILTKRANRKISLRVPQKGELKSLCEMVRENAMQKATRFASESERDNEMLIKLASMLSLEVVPERIEVYDISNIGSEHITAGMIVAEKGKLKKSDYKIFNIKTTDGIDDYGAMREALSRRAAHLSDKSGSFSVRPDLILLDGGRGHVGVIKKLFSELAIDIPIFGMVKDEHHKTRTLTDEENEISIAREQSVFMFVYGLQEEVHRFTVSKMSGAKRKTMKHSELENIKGIGAAKAKKILKKMSSLAKIKSSDFDTLVSHGISAADAHSIVEYFNEDK